MVRKIASVILVFFSMSVGADGAKPIEDFAGFPPEYSFESPESFSAVTLRRRVVVIAASAVICALLYYKYQDIKKSVKSFLGAFKNSNRKKEEPHRMSCQCTCVQQLGYCPCLKNQGNCYCKC